MPNNKNKYLEELNAEQISAVENLSGPLLVLAGAGTGKTRVLTTRLSHILRLNQATPSQIFAVTFTNKAANEMRERVERILGRSVAGWWLGTFHSLAARILRKHAELVNLKNNFTIIDSDDQIRLIKQILVSENIDEKRWPARTLLSIIQRWKDSGLNPQDINKSHYSGSDFANGEASQLYKLYQERLITLNASDFGDLLLHVINILKIHEDIRVQYQEKFKFILVDEFQDTNAAQYYWLKVLSSKHKNICAVGDDDQSIYSWRGADVNNILNYEKDFKSAKIIRLERNYRSTGNILSAASHLIANNESRLGKTLWTKDEEGDKISIRNVYDGQEEARSISDEIESYQRNKHNINDVAILVRASFQTRSFEERFLKIGLPYQVIGGLRFYERVEIRDAVAYLRLINSPDDQLAFERIINKPKRGLGEKTLQKIEFYSRSKAINLETAIRRMNETDEFTAKIRLSMKLFIKNLDRWRNHIKSDKLGNLLQTVLEESEYTDMLLKDKSIEAPGRLENLKELVNAINEFDSLSNFLEHIQLVMDGGANSNVESVKIMTLHASKGLEFNTVFLPGWEEGIFPNQKSLDENGKIGLEEERRLAYVGITRAKTNVWIFNASARLMHGQWIDSIPSRFIDEIPEKYVTNISSFADVMPEYQSGLASKWISSISKNNSQSTDKIIVQGSSSPNLNIVNDKKLHKGERIFHQKFGYGTILNIDGEKVEIKFEKSDTKKVLMSFIEKTN